MPAATIPFTAIPNSVLLSADLPQRAKLVALALIHHGRHGSCYQRISTVAKELGMSARTVQRALADLKKAGLLLWKRTGRASRYALQGALCSLVASLSRTAARMRSQAFAMAKAVIRQDDGYTEGRTTERDLRIAQLASEGRM